MCSGIMMMILIAIVIYATLQYEYAINNLYYVKICTNDTGKCATESQPMYLY